MMRITLITLYLFVTPVLFSQSVILSHIEVNPGAYSRFNTPVSLDITPLGPSLNDTSLVLYEISSSGNIEVPVQLEMGSNSRIWWILSGKTDAGKIRHFELRYGSAAETEPSMKAMISDYSVSLVKEGKNILSYRHAIQYPPEGVSEIYKRSAFIHPVVSPGGNILTRINPPDHYHHYGIWNPWTKTHFRDKEIDFWNLNLGQGTVRFAGYLSFTSGAVYTGFKSLQEHVSFISGGEDRSVINELLDTRAWNIELSGDIPAYLVDYTSVLSCATEDKVILDAYRYGGGIGFRATEEWTNKNSRVLTSEGNTRIDADASFGRWVDINGDFQSGQSSGILFMSSPTNRQHPESMRVWPVDANNGRGDMYFEFCPIRHTSWTLMPGKEYSQKYRMLIYDGTIDPETAEQLWIDFAYPPDVIIKNQ